MENLRVLGGKEIPLFRAKQIEKLDEEYYDKKYQMSLFKGLEYFVKNREGYFVLEDIATKKLVGYLSVVFINEKYYSMLKNGEVVDVLIPISAYRKMKKNKLNNAYLSSIIIAKEYRSYNSMLLLFTAFSNWLNCQFKKGKYISKMIADLVSDDGKRLGKVLNFQKIKDTTHNSQICETSFIPPSFRVINESSKTLFENYKTL